MRLSATEVRRVCEGVWRDTFRQKLKLDPKPDLSSVFRVQMGVAVEPFARRWVSGRLGVAISTLDEIVPGELGLAGATSGVVGVHDPYGTGRYVVRGSWSAKPDGLAIREVEGVGQELIVWEHKLVTNGDFAGDVVARFAPQLVVGMHVLGSRRGLLSVTYGGARCTTYQIAWCDAYWASLEEEVEVFRDFLESGIEPDDPVHPFCRRGVVPPHNCKVRL